MAPHTSLCVYFMATCLWCTWDPYTSPWVYNMTIIPMVFLNLAFGSITTNTGVYFMTGLMIPDNMLLVCFLMSRTQVKP